jgi:cobalamin biosynthesis Co2+ chelatase CbiK
MINLSYNAEENIVYLERSGTIYLQDILEIIEQVDTSSKDLTSLFLLDHVGDSTSAFDQNDYPVLLEEIRKIVPRFKEFRDALVVTTPSNTALSFLYEKLDSELPNCLFKTFSTLAAAKSWLMDSAEYKPGS